MRTITAFLLSMISATLWASNVLTYTAPYKLSEVEDSTKYGLYVHAFNVPIRSHTFADNVGTITFDGELTSIGYAFYLCTDLLTVTIPASVSHIQAGAFAACNNLTHIYVEQTSPYFTSVDGVLYDHDMQTLLRFPNRHSSTKYIIPEGVTKIEARAFNRCRKLVSVTIPNGVDTIYAYTFSRCYQMTNITLGSNIRYIDEGAFNQCSSLASVVCKAIVPPICDIDAFYGVNMAANYLFIPDESLEGYRAAPIWKDFSIMHIGDEVWYATGYKGTVALEQAIPVRQAVEIGLQLASGTSSKERYNIRGIVTGFGSRHEEGIQPYGNASFYIRDIANYKNEFFCYQVMGLNGDKLTSLDQVQLGDIVIVNSPIYNYNNTIETPSKGVAYIAYSSNPLIYPIGDVKYFEENFDHGLDQWTQESQVYPQATWRTDTSAQRLTSATIQALDANSNPFTSEEWLISPVINLSQYDAKASFLTFYTYYLKSSSDFTGNIKDYLRLKIRTKGGNWQDLEIPNFNSGKLPSYVADTIDISAYISDQTQIAFVYNSTRTFAPKWNISTISIFERKRTRSVDKDGGLGMYYFDQGNMQLSSDIPVAIIVHHVTGDTCETYMCDTMVIDKDSCEMSSSPTIGQSFVLNSYHGNLYLYNGSDAEHIIISTHELPRLTPVNSAVPILPDGWKDIKQEEPTANGTTIKFIKGGQFYILHRGKVYNAQGGVIK